MLKHDDAVRNQIIYPAGPGPIHPDGVGGGGHGGAAAVPIITEKSEILKMTFFFLAWADFSKLVVMETGLSWGNKLKTPGMIHCSSHLHLGCRGVIFSLKQEVPLPPHRRILPGNGCRRRPDGELSARSGRILLISCFYVTLDVWRDKSLEMNPGVSLSSV